jgi:hypothetical protein
MNSKVIVELGGNPARSFKTLELHKKEPEVPIILTGLEYCERTTEMLSGASLIIEDKARDTLTNFILTKHMVENKSTIYLVTDPVHARRAMGLAHIIYGRDKSIIDCSEGVEGGGDGESLLLCLVDWLRAYLWVFTKIYIPNNLFGLNADEVFNH